MSSNNQDVELWLPGIELFLNNDYNYWWLNKGIDFVSTAQIKIQLIKWSMHKFLWNITIFWGFWPFLFGGLLSGSRVYRVAPTGNRAISSPKNWSSETTQRMSYSSIRWRGRRGPGGCGTERSSSSLLLSNLKSSKSWTGKWPQLKKQPFGSWKLVLYIHNVCKAQWARWAELKGVHSNKDRLRTAIFHKDGVGWVPLRDQIEKQPNK